MIRHCASAGCGYLVRWHDYCPLHRPDLARRPDQPDRRASTTPAPKKPAPPDHTEERHR